MQTVFEATNVLRWHYGMVGHPRSPSPPDLVPFERTFALALGVADSSDFECLCPALIFNRWAPDILVSVTPNGLRGRLWLSASIGLFFTDYSRQGMPWPADTVTALKAVVSLTNQYTLEKDPWSDPNGKTEPDGLYLEFFRPFGLYVNWPLADFLKQYKWALIRNEKKVSNIVEELSALRQ